MPNGVYESDTGICGSQSAGIRKHHCFKCCSTGEREKMCVFGIGHIHTFEQTYIEVSQRASERAGVRASREARFKRSSDTCMYIVSHTTALKYSPKSYEMFRQFYMHGYCHSTPPASKLNSTPWNGIYTLEQRQAHTNVRCVQYYGREERFSLLLFIVCYFSHTSSTFKRYVCVRQVKSMRLLT